MKNGNKLDGNQKFWLLFWVIVAATIIFDNVWSC